MSEIHLKLAINTPERRQQRRSGVFIIKFEQISRIIFAVSIVDFEQVKTGWERYINGFVIFASCFKPTCFCFEGKVLTIIFNFKLDRLRK